MSAMKSYVLRIYRKGTRGNPEEIVGTLEDPNTAEEKFFSSFEELKDILKPEKRGTAHRKRGQQPKQSG